eukprot:CAMPEP_0198310978 /NCGR_PEP_ID=MMETSP1450-20131203/2858_1 /TAXON_ID=753684 ORGANISM="Madagascaria erythrocladiodes, Strain CCMP3234" /NCGR_SAMPLE_ID=MMETSP1450 /ASSEMBLY_ACC=CAM_ASM_001115 /LENGTH=661 /DNA_ID=CAMNT_0044013833 /DNA_START=499 /DNA_END=2484 /DNA_ORIENTATION=-
MALLGCLLLVLGGLGFAAAQEGSVPKPLDPDETLAPVATPTPSPRPPPPRVAPSCTNPGVSEIEPALCTGNAVVPGMTLRNSGRLVIKAQLLDTAGKKTRTIRVPPGHTVSLGDTCAYDHWFIKSTCGTCMGVVEIEDVTDGYRIDFSNEMIELTCPPMQGEWGPLKVWDVIPVGMANIPNGADNFVLGFAAKTGDDYRGMGRGNRTRAQLYNPTTGSLVQHDLDGHDIFCAALTTLPDGRIFAGGGGTADNSYKVSTYDPATLNWVRHLDMNMGHWYGTAVLAKGRVMVSLGTDKVTKTWTDASEFPEISGPGFSFDTPGFWSNMSGVNYKDKVATFRHWYPLQHVMGNGKVLTVGTQNEMYTTKINANNYAGNLQYVGMRSDTPEREAWGATSVYYSKRKVLAFGGIEGWDGDNAPDKKVYKRAIEINFKKSKNIKTKRITDLFYERAFVNGVVLPTGEVLAVGGKNNTNQWDDTMSVFAPEVWNPVTGLWTLLAPQEKPRNYHAAAILLHDGRVLSGGGGLCGECEGITDLNHFDSQIFSPPYLFKDNGDLAPRPIIVAAPNTIGVKTNFTVDMNGSRASSIVRFSLVKQCVVTHSLSTDQRQLQLKAIGSPVQVGGSKWRYTLQAQGTYEDFTKGLWFLFAINSYGTPSVAKTIAVA